MRKLLTLVALILASTLLLSGCGFSSWQDEEELKTIKEIKRVTDSEGNVYLEILYTDDSEADRFLVPEGVSINNVNSVYDSEEKKTTVTITFSEGEPYSFDIPDGVKGNSVSGVKIATLEDGIRYLVFEFVDAEGNELEAAKINISEIKGDDGATWLFGSGAPDIDPENPLPAKAGDFYLDSENYVVYNKKADGSWQNMGTIKGTCITKIQSFMDSKGDGYEIVTTEQDLDEEGNPLYDENGNPVFKSYKVYSSTLKNMGVTYNTETGMYEFVITITDAGGNEIVLGADENKIQVQRPATWLSGTLPPDLNDLPEFTSTPTFDGDFYYCTQYNTIYTKRNGEWVELVKLPSDNDVEKCTITFNPEGGVLSTNINAYPAKTEIKSDGSQVVVRVNKGECYPTTCEIPVPTRDDGYVFAGWYRKKQSPTATANINYGQFTDMVPVTADLELYAYWQKVTE